MEIRNGKIFTLYISLLLMLSVMALPILGRPSILILRNSGEDFSDVVKGIKYECDEDFLISEVVFKNKKEEVNIERIMLQYKPQMVILLNNYAVNLYKKYQKSLPDTAEVVPSIALMSLYVDRVIKGMKSACGISYEIPLLTSLMSLPKSLRDSISSVGVIYRPFLEEFINQNKKYLEKNKTTLIGKSVNASGKELKKQIKAELKNLHKVDNVDAIWVLNDNILLTSSLIRDVWLPFSYKFKKPIIVGVKVLVRKPAELGTFAVLPDHIEMGSQAADVIYRIMENEGKPTCVIQPPLSVKKVLNLRKAKKIANINEKDLETIDIVVK